MLIEFFRLRAQAAKVYFLCSIVLTLDMGKLLHENKNEFYFALMEFPE